MHYKIKCVECGIIFKQCRCQVTNKTEHMGICDRCDRDESTYTIKLETTIEFNAQSHDEALKLLGDLNYENLLWEKQNNNISSYDFNLMKDTLKNISRET